MGLQPNKTGLVLTLSSNTMGQRPAAKYFNKQKMMGTTEEIWKFLQLWTGYQSSEFNMNLRRLVRSHRHHVTSQKYDCDHGSSRGRHEAFKNASHNWLQPQDKSGRGSSDHISRDFAKLLGSRPQQRRKLWIFFRSFICVVTKPLNVPDCILHTQLS